MLSRHFPFDLARLHRRDELKVSGTNVMKLGDLSMEEHAFSRQKTPFRLGCCALSSCHSCQVHFQPLSISRRARASSRAPRGAGAGLLLIRDCSRSSVRCKAGNGSKGQYELVKDASLTRRHCWEPLIGGPVVPVVRSGILSLDSPAVPVDAPEAACYYSDSVQRRIVR